MSLDKKVKDSKMVYIIPRGIGSAYITNKIKKGLVINALNKHV